MLVDRDGYEIYDLQGKKTSEFKSRQRRLRSADLVGRDSMTDAHFANFIAAIQKGEKLNAPYRGRQCRGDHAPAFEHCVGGKTRTASRHEGRKIQNDAEAMKMWAREYENGWAPHV